MYKLSYEKCVCFIFLVMVAFLSCSGFRIDKLAMTDVSKKNSYTSSTSLNSHSNFLNRLIQSVPNLPSNFYNPESRIRRNIQRPHRIRHSRKAKLQAKFDPVPTSRIDAIIVPPSNDFTEFETFRPNRLTTRPPEKFAQIPPTDVRPLQPTAAIVTRSQRSPNKNKKQRNKLSCQEQDVGRKAYLADTVVLAKAESMSSNRVRNYSVSFKILRSYKSRGAVDDNLRLTFLNDTKRMNCESDLHGGHHGVVRAQIQQSEEYYLFLKSHGNHNYTVLGMPVLKRRRKNNKIEQIINSVTKTNFEPKIKKPTLKRLDASATSHPKDKVRLECRVKGYPIPVIRWKKHESFLHNNNNTRITYSNKGRKSTLVIRNSQEKDSGRYSCVATSVNGQTLISHKDIQISNSNIHGEECKMPIRNAYCSNGGTCFQTSQLGEFSCVCPTGFHGEKCEQKEVSVPLNTGSMYRECLLGVPAFYC